MVTAIGQHVRAGREPGAADERDLRASAGALADDRRGPLRRAARVHRPTRLHGARIRAPATRHRRSARRLRLADRMTRRQTRHAGAARRNVVRKVFASRAAGLALAAVARAAAEWRSPRTTSRVRGGRLELRGPERPPDAGQQPGRRLDRLQRGRRRALRGPLPLHARGRARGRRSPTACRRSPTTGSSTRSASSRARCSPGPTSSHARSPQPMSPTA